MLAAPRPLDPADDVSAFDCGAQALNVWLQRHAVRNEGKGSRTFAVCEARRVAGYYALAAGHVERVRAPSGLSRNMPDPIPVIVLGRLAIDRDYRGRGLGTALLKDALARSLNAAREIGARAVLVHAIDGRAAEFYLQYGFRPFAAEPLTLFMAMEQIAAAL